MKKKITAILLCAALLLQGSSVYAAVKTDISISSAIGSANITALTQNDQYKTYDTFYALDDTSVNRMTSEHFQIIWGNGEQSGKMTYDHVKGNLINLENIRSFYVDELGMKDIGISQNPEITEKRKTNIYVSNTGLEKFEDDWAYMAVDGDSFAYLFVAPDAMRVDEPSWVLPHELAHAFTYHQGGTIPYAWYESTANWFRDQYLGSEYYAYGGRTYGPTSDFFTPYVRYSDRYVPHMLQWYDTWPIFTYISENPDNIEGLGMPLMHKILEYNAPSNASMFDTIETLSGVPKKEFLAGFTRRMATYDFSRQQYYLQSLETVTNDLKYYDNVDLKSEMYTTLNAADSEGYRAVPENKAPMAAGFNVVPLDVDLSKSKLTADIVNTSTAQGADLRASLVTATASNVTRYSNIVKGSGTAEIALNGDETKAFLVVCATPDTIKNYEVNWNSSAGDTDTRYTYKAKISTSDESNTHLLSADAGRWSAGDILGSPDHFTVTDNATSKEGQIKINSGNIEFYVSDGAEITIGYKCGSTSGNKSAAVVLNGKTSLYVNAGDPEQTFTVGGLTEGTYNITAKQNGGSSAQITYINVYYPINGDVNKNGYVDKADAKMLLDHITGISTITDGTALYNADCDGIDGIDLRDAIYILKTE